MLDTGHLRGKQRRWRVAAALCLAFTLAACGSSGGSDPEDLSALVARVDALEARVATLEAEAEDHESRIATLESGASGGTLQSQIDALSSDVSANETAIAENETAIAENGTAIAENGTAIEANADLISGQAASITALQSSVTNLAAKTANMSLETIAGRSAVVFDGVNVHIRNGLGQTECDDGSAYPVCNGLGNLVIGYGEQRSVDSDKSGSHNVVLGPGNNYDGFAGWVAGNERYTASYGLTWADGAAVLEATGALGLSLSADTTVGISSAFTRMDGDSTLDLNGGLITLN